MKIQHIAMSLGLASVSLLALSLGNRAGGASPVALEAAARPEVRVEPKKFGEHMMIAPVYVTLTKGATDASGETEMKVFIQANDVVRYPVTIEVSTPPRDGVLTAGTRVETLDLSGGGNHERSFKVKAPSGFDESNAFKVVVKGGNAALGFYAEKQYPPAPELKVPARQGPTPPTGRPPAPMIKPGIVPQLSDKRALQTAKGVGSESPRLFALSHIPKRYPSA